MVFCHTWNALGLVNGNYSLSVRIELLEKEMDLDDNSVNGSWIFITIPGDLNGDKTVDIYDAIRLADQFGLTPTHSLWNPIVDLKEDGLIDIFDAIVVAGHFNQTPINPLWDADVDINGDNTVDIYDAIILANHYNQHYP